MDLEHLLKQRPDLPEPLAEFIRAAVPRLSADRRIVGLAAAGSFIAGPMDEYSDLDLVIAIEPEAVAEVMAQRRAIATRLGPLLAAFTGEHVGEPRVLICLFGPPLIHVDLKFVSLDQAGERVEDPVIIWERDARLSRVLGASGAEFPAPDLQWIEDRFWVWLHYGAAKVGRGELFEAHDFLAFLRMQVLGPLALLSQGARPSGVRKLESAAPGHVGAIRRTLAAYEPVACLDALGAAADLYRELRDALPAVDLELRPEAEKAAVGYLAEIRAQEVARLRTRAESECGGEDPAERSGETRVWNERYCRPGFAFGAEPNEFLASLAPRIPSGRVLCLGAGEGRNAVYLAGLGYEVVAVDRATAGLAKARKLAAARQVTIDTIAADLADFDLGEAAWSGIVSIFGHFDPALRRHIHARIVAGLKPGGVLILEAYTPEQLDLGTGGPSRLELMMTLKQLRLELAGLDLVHAVETRRQIGEGSLHSGPSAVVQVLGIKPAPSDS